VRQIAKIQKSPQAHQQTKASGQNSSDSHGFAVRQKLLTSFMGISNTYDSALQKAPFLEEFRQLVTYRDLIYQMVSRNIKSRYKRSVLGIAWTMINPLMTTVILSLVFSALMKSAVPYYTVYLLSGMIAWSFFAQTSLAAMQELIWGGTLLNRIYLPKAVFAASALGTGLVNFLLSLPPLFLVMAFTGVPFKPALLFLPVSLLILTIFTIGLGLMLSALAIFFIDVVDMYQLLLTAWYFLTPILYPLSIVPPERHWLFKLNPMYHIIEVFRAPIHAGALPGIKTISAATAIACGTLVIGWWIFTRRADQFAYRV
jgi:ABC-type polysaccharide/polyol phosphate export permease